MTVKIGHLYKLKRSWALWSANHHDDLEVLDAIVLVLDIIRINEEIIRLKVLYKDRTYMTPQISRLVIEWVKEC